MAEFFSRYRQFLPIVILALIVIAGTFFFLPRPAPTSLTIITPAPKPTPTVALIKIDVRGAVNQPGIYALAPGSRIQDALAAAGNLLANADASKLNLARKLNDGEQINVPRIGETPAASAPTTSAPRPAASTASAPSGKINLNLASQTELETLPGIGPTIARAIVDYREQSGKFKTLDEVKKVRGIGDALYDRIKDKISLE